ncbi:uncharacterized protein LOC111621864 [Centruroides sculpturatus]|uniref:uncharacterized protein LOC111621864 n=1 Tax=Centruroides sculpturatus TaxID=218467 RepID=UPI000C6D89A7|nr:uncharacterized protein LOC111621864 [Centruroides sculpturatus]
MYNLENFLKSRLQKYQNSQFAIHDTDEFMCDIKKLDIDETLRMVSLNIVNMYPSINLENDIEPEIIDLMEFAYRSNYFEIKDRYFTKTEGISMGSVIGPKLAGLVMIDIDNDNNRIPGIYFYRRYVDDIFVVYRETQIKLEQIKESNSYPLSSSALASLLQQRCR